MRTVQMTLEEDLVSAVDRLAKKLHTTRSGFARIALREALSRYQKAKLERQHQKGYEAKPVEGDEFSLWEGEQVWG